MSKRDEKIINCVEKCWDMMKKGDKNKKKSFFVKQRKIKMSKFVENCRILSF